MPYVTRTDDVFTLFLGDEGVELSESNPENRFSPGWVDAVHARLDEIEAQAAGSPAALVITATGKFFSNGLDVMYILANVGELPSYLDRVHTVYSRLLTFPMATVAAVNGHAFGAGAMLALSCDFAVMREDRGFFCLPEVSLKMGFTVGMATLLRSRLPYQTAVEAMTTGRRYGGADAVAAGIVQSAVAEAEVLRTATALAAGNAAADGPTLNKIKNDLHAPLIADLAVPTTEVKFG
ncbi:enoyl-CoA hydratase/isomerase family protein [Tsukamurella asaccharolytica]|uniref:Enoyl-CoA hydratase/isomerase family protein n=1 Tax=Tsukamurella asaccharolytica TaxID=2592067 RepID=A0A5C5RAW1_9ACTN|nr:enoyl-CoA hydratase/isomerase family protein [Tsukamurella asaccharolytica]TWS19255.1 enoyl-CoA hydratase/isomerase family protein [Tsukamurella asaccharolytica]